jgi:hypothetical protein
VLAVYVTTLVVSAFLLFLVQPMFAKMVLPSLGGTPAVWNTCMVFFQAMLLAGYAYVHLGSRWLTPARQAGVHVALVVVTLFALPIWPRALDPGETAPVPWLIGMLLVSLGAPFFVLSATAPLLQRWFAASGHARAHDPYFLYAASNVGSLAALVGYPLLVEPLLALHRQSTAWSVGYVLLAVLMALCVWLLLRAGRHAPASAAEADPRLAAQPVTSGRRVRWVLLAFAPSSLLLGVTTYVTTDVAAVPLLWVVPLALYLLSFILVFAQRPLLPHGWMLALQPFLLLAVLLPTLWNYEATVWQKGPLHLLLFFVSAMVCHGELAKDRPGPTHLTEYYLWMSVGGVLGGLFNALLAPALLNDVLEYPIALAIACLLRPKLQGGEGWGRWARWIDFALPAGCAGALLLFLQLNHMVSQRTALVAFAVLTGAIALLLYWSRIRPVRFGLTIGAMLLIAMFVAGRQSTVFTERSFFGVHRVAHSIGGDYAVLIHGTTIHGAQSTDPGKTREPLTYFHRDGPLGQLFGVMDHRLGRGHIGVAGLGAGAIACYGKVGGKLSFFEIDPLVVRIARDSGHFTYLAQCSGTPPRIVLGDARLTLAREPEAEFAVLVLDAFSSDSLPVHLMTREAVELYLRKLAPGGVLVFNISNRYLDLAPALAAIGRDLGLVGRISTEHRTGQRGERWQPMRFPATFVALARTREDLGSLWWDGRWAALPEAGSKTAWTDDFSNILEALHLSFRLW